MVALGTVVALVGALAAGIAVTLFVMGVLELIAQSRESAKTRRRVVGSGAAVASSQAVIATMTGNGQIGRLLSQNRFGQTLVMEVGNAGIALAPDEFVKRVLWGALGGFLLATLFSRSPGAGLVVAIGVCVAARVWLQGAAEKRLEMMRRQLPDAFTLVGSSLSSGLSLVQSLKYASDETPRPLGPALGGLVNDVAAGRSLSEALERFRTSVPLTELHTISTAIEIQHRTGGNMREMLEQATSAVRQSIELRMSLDSQTAQSRLSAKVVGLMPLVLLCVISLFSKDYMSSFFSTPAGIVLFSIGITLDLVGYAIIRKIMNIEV